MRMQERDCWVSVLAVMPSWLTAVWVERHGLTTFFSADELAAISRAAGFGAAAPRFRALSAGLVTWVEYHAFGLNPIGYHAVNLALHLLAATGVYAIVQRLSSDPRLSGAAALIFAASGIAFTPLHDASGIGDLLACVLLQSATLLLLAGRQHGRAGLVWLASATAAIAVLAKETAVAWPLVALAIDRWVQPPPRGWRPYLPLVLCWAAVMLWLVTAAQTPGSGAEGPYGTDFSAWHLVANLQTYASWCVTLGSPIRDRVGNSGVLSWWFPVLLSGALGALVWWNARHPQRLLLVGLAWWLAFILPVLPFAHHSYLYYLYIPWVGGSAVLAVLARNVVTILVRPGGTAAKASGVRWRARALAACIGVGGLVGFVIAESRGIAARETQTVDTLPADRTIREAMLLEHAVSSLRALSLPAGTVIGFVNPVPGLASPVPTHASHAPVMDQVHSIYLPLQVALVGSDALRLFAPGVVDSGFAVTIPATWGNVECLLFEQRGWLRDWGHGQQALMRQGELQGSVQRWAAAESSFARVRAMGDTMPSAVIAQCIALQRRGASTKAQALADSFAMRWGPDPRAAALRQAIATGVADSSLMRPFDTRVGLEFVGGRAKSW